MEEVWQYLYDDHSENHVVDCDEHDSQYLFKHYGVLKDLKLSDLEVIWRARRSICCWTLEVLIVLSVSKLLLGCLGGRHWNT